MNIKLSENELSNLKQLISSSDPDNWKLAEQILKCYECENREYLLREIWVKYLILLSKNGWLIK